MIDIAVVLPVFAPTSVGGVMGYHGSEDYPCTIQYLLKPSKLGKTGMSNMNTF